MRWVSRFKTIKEAKDFLADTIASEAEREGVPLSDVERKMLYFSETGSSLPDILAVNEEFERDYEEDDYEHKIAGLVRKIEARNGTSETEIAEAWHQAFLMLSEGDHYLTVLANIASENPNSQIHGHGFIPTFDTPAVRPPHDWLKLWATAFLVLIGGLVLVLLSDWLKHR